MGSKPANGSPAVPAAPQYMGDPSKFNSYDRSALMNRAISGIANDTGNQQRQGLAQATAMNGGRSAGNARLSQDLGAQGQMNMANVRNQAGLASWQDKIGQMNALNQNALGRYATQANIYGINAQANEAEQQRRQKNLADALPGLGNFFNL